MFLLPLHLFGASAEAGTHCDPAIFGPGGALFDEGMGPEAYPFHNAERVTFKAQWLGHGTTPGLTAASVERAVVKADPSLRDDPTARAEAIAAEVASVRTPVTLEADSWSLAAVQFDDLGRWLSAHERQVYATQVHRTLDTFVIETMGWENDDDRPVIIEFQGEQDGLCVVRSATSKGVSTAGFDPQTLEPRFVEVGEEGVRFMPRFVELSGKSAVGSVTMLGPNGELLMQIDHTYTLVDGVHIPTTTVARLGGVPAWTLRLHEVRVTDVVEPFVRSMDDVADLAAADQPDPQATRATNLRPELP